MARLLDSSTLIVRVHQQHLLQSKAAMMTKSGLMRNMIGEGSSCTLFTGLKRRHWLADAQVRNKTTISMKENYAVEKDDEDDIIDDEKEEEKEEPSEEAEEEAEMFGESKGSYQDMSMFLSEAFSHDREIQDIFESAFEAPEEMGKRVNERFKRKEKDIVQSKTGTSVPMKVSFCEFDATDSYIWMELYNSPSKKDIDIIGSAIRAWYVLGCLGGYNSLNIQLTKIPVNERLRYKEYVEDDLVPAQFVNVGELEFQHNLGRFWVDLGTSDPLSLDVLINAFTSISSDYVAIRELLFGGNEAGRWKEEITSEEEGYLSFKI